MPKYGEIYWVFAKDLDIAGHEQDKSRPYVIVSRDAINNQGLNVVGVPLSTKTHKANAHRILIPIGMMIKDVSCTRTMSDSVDVSSAIEIQHAEALTRSRRTIELESVGALQRTGVRGSCGSADHDSAEIATGGTAGPEQLQALAAVGDYHGESKRNSNIQGERCTASFVGITGISSGQGSG